MTNFNYYSDALGKRIYTKKDYQEAMKQGGFIPYKEAKQIAEQKQKDMYKPYDKLSDKTLSLIRDMKMSSKKDGSIKLSDRQIDAMKKTGINFNPRFMPTNIKEGGF